MATWALIIDGAVSEITNIDPTGRFHPSLVWASSPSSVSVGYTYDGKAFAAPVAPPVDLEAYLTAKRFEIETGGIEINGSRILTDRDSQALITGAYSYVQANPSTTVQFKTAEGFVALTAEQVMGIANAVGAHVQACFAVEASVSAAIAAGTVKTTADVDAADWPSE